jgi:hypothetical protein
MQSHGDISIIVYQARDSDFRGDIGQIRDRLEKLKQNDQIQGLYVEECPGIVRDATAGEQNFYSKWSEKANNVKEWKLEQPQDIELLFLDRGEFRSSGPRNETSNQIRFNTPFFELWDENGLRGAFPSRIEDAIVDLDYLIDVLRENREWPARRPEHAGYRSSGSTPHDAWRNQFIEHSESFLGPHWETFDTETQAEGEDITGWVDIVFQHGTNNNLYLVEIKPETYIGELDRAIGQLLRYRETLARQSLLEPVRSRETRLAIASPTIPEETKEAADSVGIDTFELK